MGASTRPQISYIFLFGVGKATREVIDRLSERKIAISGLLVSKVKETTVFVVIEYTV